MLFTKILLDRFTSFKDETEIDLSIGKDSSKNIILIWWENGAWKTSVLLAVNILFYGMDTKNLIQYFNDSAIREWNAWCKLWVEFEDDNWDIIKIIKKWNVVWDYSNDKKISPSMITQDFYAWKNWHEWENFNESLWNEWIQVKIPKWVSEFSFFEWENIQSMSDDTSPNLLRDSIEKIIWLEKINILMSDLESVKKDIRISISSTVKSTQIDEYKNMIEWKKISLKWLKEDLQQIENDLQVTTDKADILENNYQNRFWIKSQDSEKRKSIELKLKELREEETEINTNIKNYINDQLPYVLLMPFHDEVEANLKKTKEYNEYQLRKNWNEELKNKIIKSLFQPKDIIWWNEWDESNREKLENAISDMLEEEEKEPSVLNLWPDDEKNLIAFWSRLNWNATQVISWLNRREQLKRDIRNKESEKELVSVNPDREKEQKELDEEIRVTKNRIDDLEREKKNKKNEIIDLENEIENLNNQLSRMIDWFNKSKRQREALEKIDNYYRALSQFKEKLRTKKVWTLSENIEKMFKQIFNKSSNVKSIEINPTTYTIDIIDQFWDRKPKKKLSTWEKSIFALSMIWWLAQTSNFKLPIIIDAPLSVLSKDHVDNVLKEYFPNAAHQVIILTKWNDLRPWSEEYNLIKDCIYKEYMLEFESNWKETKTVVKWWYFYN